MLSERLKRVPAWLVLALLAAVVLGWAWYRHRQAAAAADDEGDQGDELPHTMPPSTAGSVAPMTYATNDQDDEEPTGRVPPMVSAPGSTAQAAMPWIYGGNTATPADTYGTGHPTPITYS
jgi:hypothetical protein